MKRLRHFVRVSAAALSLLALPLLCSQAKATSYDVIHIFPTALNGSDGSFPMAGLVADSAGRLYGTTMYGGPAYGGTVYRLTPPAIKGGAWTSEVLHNFTYATDGADPAGRLLVGASGEIYGTTSTGGPLGGGTVFRLDNAPGWPLSILHSFDPKSPDGYLPRGSLVIGPNGLLYGTTASNQSKHAESNAGAVFSLSPLGDSAGFAVIHQFTCLTPGPQGGCGAPDDLIATPDGSLYGAAMRSGLTANSVGAMFRMRLSREGDWVYTIVHDFAAGGVGTPRSLVRDGQGLFYGCGLLNSAPTIFSLTSSAEAGQTYAQSTLYSYIAPGGTYPACAGGVIPGADGSVIATVKTISYPGNKTSYTGALLQLEPPANGLGPWSATMLHQFGGTRRIGTASPTGSLLRQGAEFYGVVDTYAGKNGGQVYGFRP